MHLYGAALLICTKVRVANHGNVWLFVKEAHGVCRKFSNIYQHVLVGVTIDECVGNVECALLCIENVHSTEVFVFRTNAYNLFCYLDGV